MRRPIPKTFLMLFVLAKVVSAQSNLIEFERISERDGLSQFSVYSILQDSEGYLWFGSLDGLSRYDGYNFKVFKSNPNDSASLSDDLILSLHEDAAGTIWIGTATGGLNKFNRETGEFINFPLSDFVVASQDENVPIVEAPIPYSLLVNKSITKIFEDSRGYLWIGTWGGRILLFDKYKEEFLPYTHPDTKESMLYRSPIMEIYEDSENALWIGTFGGGLFRHGFLTNSTGQSAHADNVTIFQHYGHDPWNANSLANDRVVAVLEAQPGVLFVATFGGGISVLNSTTGDFINYEYDEKNPASISGDELVSLFRDSVGDVWVGTFGNGLNRIPATKHDKATQGNGTHNVDYKHLKFIHYAHQSANPKSLSDNGILTIYEDRGGVLWFGAHRGGVNKFVRRHSQFMHCTHNPYDTNSLNDRTVTA
ncbi:MAG: two-component regulator propeller domain-containing protein, partial [bacterium]